MKSGGLGLTGGIVDVEGLFDCLQGIHSHLASPSILQTYSEQRLKKWHEIVNPVSSSNIKRMFSQNPDTALEDDEFLQTVKKAETDEELSKVMQSSSNRLKYDFTQHYDGASKGQSTGDSGKTRATNGLDTASAASFVPPAAT